MIFPNGLKTAETPPNSNNPQQSTPKSPSQEEIAKSMGEAQEAARLKLLEPPSKSSMTNLQVLPTDKTSLNGKSNMPVLNKPIEVKDAEHDNSVNFNISISGKAGYLEPKFKASTKGEASAGIDIHGHSVTSITKSSGSDSGGLSIGLLGYVYKEETTTYINPILVNDKWKLDTLVIFHKTANFDILDIGIGMDHKTIMNGHGDTLLQTGHNLLGVDAGVKKNNAQFGIEITHKFPSDTIFHPH